MENALDDFLSGQDVKVHKRAKRLLALLREAYPHGVPALLLKSHTDRLGAAAGHAFHLGTPDRELRRIASWLLTHGEQDTWELCRLVPMLWARHGREDCILAALLLANLRPPLEPVGSDAWAVLIGIVGEVESAETLLFAIEEFHRAKIPAPEESVLLRMMGEGGVRAHLGLLIHHSIWLREGRGPLSEDALNAIQGVAMPAGDSLLGRVRDQLLGAAA